jgi:hypothetical protein
MNGTADRMRPFTYQRATDALSAVQALTAAAPANKPLTDAVIQPLAGGTTLLDLMKLDVCDRAFSSTSTRYRPPGRPLASRAAI